MATNANTNQSSSRQQASNENQDQIVKDIEKVGFLSLKLVDNNEASAANYQRFWGMFYVIQNNNLNDEQPILELFQREQKLQHVNQQDSVAKISLKNTLHVSIPILFNEKENENEFVISLESQLLQIYVDNKELMIEWVDCLRNKLASLNIFSPKDNIYTKEPMSSNKKTINRPLPPIPTEQSTETVRQVQEISRPIERLIDRLQGRTVDRRRNSNESSLSVVHPSDSISSNQMNHLMNQINQPLPTTSNNNYEHLAIGNSINHQPSHTIGVFNGDNQYNTLSSYRSAQSTESIQSNDQVMSLRESQVFQLQKEINNRGGVKLRIRKVDCLDSLAIVEWLGRIWIAGWKQKYYPQLHNTFKVGDELIYVNGYRVTSAKDVQCIIRQSEEPIIEFIIRRTPYGKVFLLKREHSGQELGIIREGNTGEILFVEPNSLAHKHGIPNHTKPVDALRKTDINFFITEINNRPLNLFFKGEEIKARLNAVGLEITLLLQPLDLVKNIRKQMKLIKNYKDYIVQ